MNSQHPIEDAVRSFDLSTVKSRLLQYPEEKLYCDAEGNSLAHLALLGKYGAELETLKLLVSLGVHIDHVRKDGTSALHIAAWIDDPAVLEWLASHIDKRIVNVFDATGNTALQWAASRSGSTVRHVSALLSLDADVHVRDLRESWTALHGAALWNHVDIAKVLLDAGADPNTADFAGNTPLHVCAQERLAGMYELLMKYGANQHAMNAAGLSPDQISGSLRAAGGTD